MTYKNNILLGFIRKVKGFEGAVTVKLERSFYDNNPEMESVFLEIEGKQVPFFISYREYTGNGDLVLKFEGYDTVESVSELMGCRIFLPGQQSIINEHDDIRELRGYNIFSGDKQLLGTITEVITDTENYLLNMNTSDGRQILLPFHSNLIVDIDNNSRSIIMDLPDGIEGI